MRQGDGRESGFAHQPSHRRRLFVGADKQNKTTTSNKHQLVPERTYACVQNRAYARTTADPIVKRISGPEVQHQSAERQRLRRRPIDAVARHDGVEPFRKQPLQVRVYVKTSVVQLVTDGLVVVMVLGQP